MEEGENKAGILGLYKKLLAINYYETIEPQEFTQPEQPLRKVPTNFSSVEVNRICLKFSVSHNVILQLM